MKNKQTILITGATGNIGGGAAVALAKRGAKLVLLGRRLETLETRADDFSDVESVRRAASEAKHRFPEIHGLVLEKTDHLTTSGRFWLTM